MFGFNYGYGQNSTTRDTMTINDESLDEIIYYSSRDSLYTDLKNKQVHLYGDAKVKYGDVDRKSVV